MCDFQCSVTPKPNLLTFVIMSPLAEKKTKFPYLHIPLFVTIVPVIKFVSDMTLSLKTAFNMAPNLPKRPVGVSRY